MEHIKLYAKPREVTGKAVRHLRREGIVPIIVYGGGLKGAVSLQAEARELARVLGEAGAVKVIDLDVNEESYPVLARAVQRHPTRHDLMHVDFLAVNLKEVIEAEIPVVLVNESRPAVQNEAVLVSPIDTLAVSALPDSLPAQIEVDISVLEEIGHSIHAGDIAYGEGVELVTDPETVVATLVAPTRAAAEVEEAAEGEEEEAEAEEAEEAEEEEDEE